MYRERGIILFIKCKQQFFKINNENYEYACCLHTPNCVYVDDDDTDTYRRYKKCKHLYNEQTHLRCDIKIFVSNISSAIPNKRFHVPPVSIEYQMNSDLQYIAEINGLFLIKSIN